MFGPHGLDSVLLQNCSLLDHLVISGVVDFFFLTDLILMNSGTTRIIWIKAYLSSSQIIFLEGGMGVTKYVFPNTTLSLSSRISPQCDFFWVGGGGEEVGLGRRALTKCLLTPLFSVCGLHASLCWSCQILCRALWSLLAALYGCGKDELINTYKELWRWKCFVSATTFLGFSLSLDFTMSWSSLPFTPGQTLFELVGIVHWTSKERGLGFAMENEIVPMEAFSFSWTCQNIASPF